MSALLFSILKKTKLVFVGFSVSLTLILTTAFCVSSFFEEEHEEIISKEVKKFKTYKNLDLIRSAKTRASYKFPKKPLKEIVLLFHSFATSPEDYEPLFRILDKKGISYYAPTILGFGLEDTGLLEKIEAEDWARQAIETYELCAQLAEEVHVVGQSLGTLMAVMVAKMKKPRKVILLSPALFLKGKILSLKQHYQNNWFFRTYIKYIKKYLALPLVARPIFRYESLPINSLEALVKFQNIILNDPSPLHESAVHVLYGKDDEISDTESMLHYLKKNKVPYKSYQYDTAHSLLIEHGHDKQKILNRIGKILEE